LKIYSISQINAACTLEQIGTCKTICEMEQKTLVECKCDPCKKF